MPHCLSHLFGFISTYHPSGLDTPSSTVSLPLSRLTPSIVPCQSLPTGWQPTREHPPTATGGIVHIHIHICAQLPVHLPSIQSSMPASAGSRSTDSLLNTQINTEWMKYCVGCVMFFNYHLKCFSFFGTHEKLLLSINQRKYYSISLEPIGLSFGEEFHFLKNGLDVPSVWYISYD